MSTVRLKLCFPRTTRSNPASKTGKRFTFSLQTRIQIAKLSKFYLQFSLAAFGSQCKNIQNECCKIDNFFSVQRLRKIYGLGRGKLAIKKNGQIQSFQPLAQFLDLSFPEIGCRIDFPNFGIQCSCI